MACREVTIDLHCCLWMECFSPPWRAGDRIVLAVVGSGEHATPIAQRLVESSPGVDLRLFAGSAVPQLELPVLDEPADELRAKAVVLIADDDASGAFREALARLCLWARFDALFLIDGYHVLTDITRHAKRRTAEGRSYRGFSWVEPETWQRLYRLTRSAAGSRAVVEIGSFVGGTTLALAAACRDGARQPAVTIDPILGNGFHQTIAAAALEASVLPFEERSEAVAERWPALAREHGIGPAVGLLFVDGDHTFRGVAGDLRGWLPHLAGEALIVVHDYFNPFQPGVARAVRECLEEDEGWRISERLEDAVVCCRRR
jgi:predicted O-methyltransferase YrrM